MKLTDNEKTLVSNLAKEFPHSFEVVKDVYEVVKDINHTRSILEHSSMTATSVYPIIDLIRKSKTPVYIKPNSDWDEDLGVWVPKITLE